MPDRSRQRPDHLEGPWAGEHLWQCKELHWSSERKAGIAFTPQRKVQVKEKLPYLALNHVNVIQVFEVHVN